MTGTVRTTPQLDRVLATVLFTDLVESTQRLINAGDRGWADLVGQHHAIVRGLLKTYRGWENDTAGDGFFATFDGPTRAVRCAREIVRSLQLIGLAVRAGIHAGECETADGKAAGIAVGHRGTSDGSSGRRPDPGYQHPERPRGRFRAHLHRRRSARAQGNPRHVAPLCGRGWLSGHRDDPAAAGRPTTTASLAGSPRANPAPRSRRVQRAIGPTHDHEGARGSANSAPASVCIAGCFYLGGLGCAATDGACCAWRRSPLVVLALEGGAGGGGRSGMHRPCRRCSRHRRAEVTGGSVMGGRRGCLRCAGARAAAIMSDELRRRRLQRPRLPTGPGGAR